MNPLKPHTSTPPYTPSTSEQLSRLTPEELSRRADRKIADFLESVKKANLTPSQLRALIEEAKRYEREMRDS